ncbi:glycosyltransferase family 2 protein [Plantactinospora sonchi]|uniref:Glycosyltransferase family 2 protein n=1 Tax=Plantactinospora sonchi TaxID=1544735 RepID=A0ABU7S579_9ACTN
MSALVTVVVPIFNVEDYLPECLDSLARQTWRGLDVVLVDDGSTDGSAPIAADWAARDDRFRLLRQANRGLGAARNAGLDHGTGDHLMFVDSDDVLPPYAVEVLVGALERSGSDFVSGNVALLTGQGLRQSWLHRGTHRTTRLGITLRDQPNLVYDRLACNKLFRRSFWDRHGLRFPEGVRYEDIPVTIPAYALAGAVDVLDLPVYYWRQRPPGAVRSLSQRQTEVRNLVDRFAAVAGASRSLSRLADPELKRWYDESALRSDLRMFLDLLPEVDDTYRRRFLDLAVDFLTGVDERVLDRLAPRLRIAWRLARARALPELLAVLAAGSAGQPSAVVRRGLRHYLDLPLLDAGHPAVPRRAYRAPGGVRTEVHEARWVGDRLLVRGLAYDVSRGAARPWHPIRLLWLRAPSRRWRRMLPLPTRVHPTGGVAGPAAGRRRHHERAAWAGFSTLVDPRRLRGRGGWATGDWSFLVLLVGGGRPRPGMLAVGDARPALPARWVDAGVRVVPFVRSGRLWLRVERPGAWVTGVRVAEGALLVEGVAGRRPGPGTTLCLSRVTGVVGRAYPVQPLGVGVDPSVGADGVVVGDGRWVARVPLTHLVADSALVAGDGSAAPGGPVPSAGPAERTVLVGEAGAGWRVALAEPGAEPVELPVPADFTGVRRLVGPVELMARPTDDGVLWLRVLPPGPVAAAAELTDGVLILSGGLPTEGEGWAELLILLRHRESGTPTGSPLPDVVLPTEVRGAWWSVRIPLTGAAAPADGDWAPLYRRGPGGMPVDLPFDVSARRMLPRDVNVGIRRLELLSDREREVIRLGPRPAR